MNINYGEDKMLEKMKFGLFEKKGETKTVQME